MTAPNPPPRGGAEPRVSAETFGAICDFAQREYVKGEATTMQMIALDARDLRAKLEAAEGRSWGTQPALSGALNAANTRADAADAALREMTEQRDGAWKAGALAMRNAAALELSGLAPFASRNDERQAQRSMREAGVAAVRALAPPAETAAKEERT